MKAIKKQRHLHRERGQSLVELAISLTVILLLLAGAVDFGMALFSYVMLRDAAQEGALFGSLNPYLDEPVGSGNGQYDPSEPLNVAAIQNRVRAASTSPIISGLTNSMISVTTTDPSMPPCEGTTIVNGFPASNAIEVKITYQYHIIMPYIGAIIGSQTIPLTADVTDTILTPACP